MTDGGPVPPPGRRSGAGSPGAAGLPVPVSCLVGRHRERSELAALLADERLVTLTGPGGCGKTRLALAVAHDVAPGVPDGACWVELSEVRDPAAVVQALADAVGVREEAGRPLAATVTGELRGRRGLVVLDNCEHVVAACADLVTGLLLGCPGMSVLTTSREPLAVDGEVTWQVAPLAVPDAGAVSPAEVAVADAVVLFLARARRARPDFALTDRNAATVAEICRRLDGLPLAVELAATRVRLLSVEQIAAGLSDRFRLLTGGGRCAPTRQQTLLASVEWSADLLDDASRLALARLSVFAGGFDLAAAAAVVAGPGIVEDTVLDLLAGLVDRSLLQVGERDGRARYRMLETVRVFAWDRLAELDDPDRVRQAHLAFVVDLAGRARAGLDGAECAAWTARLAAHLGDLRAAMAWAVDSGQPSAVLRIADPTRRFWFDRGRYAEMSRWLGAAVDCPALPAADRARGLVTTSLVTSGSGRQAAAFDAADRGVLLAGAEAGAGARAAVEETLALGLGLRAATGLWSGRSSSAAVAADVEQALQRGGRLRDPAVGALVQAFAAVTTCDGRSLADGTALFEQALAACDEAGVEFTRPTVQVQLGAYLLLRGELDRAQQHAGDGLAWARRVHRPGWEACALTVLAAADLHRGEVAAAAERVAAAEDLLRARSLAASVFQVLVGRWAALVAYGSAQPDRARLAADALARRARQQQHRYSAAWASLLLGLVDLAEQRPADAARHLGRCRELSTEPGYPSPLGRALVGLGRLDPGADDGWELAHRGLRVLADAGDRLGVADALLAVAELAVGRGRTEQALRLLAATDRFHADAGIVRLPVDADRARRCAALARARLAPDVAAAACADGHRLCLADAVGYARRGRGERARPRHGWDALTPTEREVVRLLAEGRTNAEIGRRLFVSVHTVKAHLAHVYRKLGLGGRAALAAAAARRDAGG